AGNSGFQSPQGVSLPPKLRFTPSLPVLPGGQGGGEESQLLTALKRAVGLGYQQEVMARLKGHTLGYSHAQLNTPLSSSEETFPLDQGLYFDFSHDTNMVSVLAAFGLRQFGQFLEPDRHPGPHNFTVSHVTPFGARLDIE